MEMISCDDLFITYSLPPAPAKWRHSSPFAIHGRMLFTQTTNLAGPVLLKQHLGADLTFCSINADVRDAREVEFCPPTRP